MYSENMLLELIDIGVFTKRYVKKKEYEKYLEQNNPNIICTIVHDEESNADFYRIVSTYGITEDEVMTYIQLSQAKQLISIKKMVNFLVVIAVIGIIAGVLIGFNIL